VTGKPQWSLEGLPRAAVGADVYVVAFEARDGRVRTPGQGEGCAREKRKTIEVRWRETSMVSLKQPSVTGKQADHMVSDRLIEPEVKCDA